MKHSKTVNVLLLVLRVLTVANIVCMFFAGLNPARISGLIGRNTSLFTCGISRSTITDNMGRALIRGWVDNGTVTLLMISCIVMLVAGILGLVCACTSLGNNKLRKRGFIFSVAGAVIEMFGIGGIYMAYSQVLGTVKPDKVEPMWQWSSFLFIGMAALILILSVVGYLLSPKVAKDEKCEMDKGNRLFLMFIPVIVLVFLFSYLPLWGWRYAFFDYKAGQNLSIKNWAGFKWFTMLFQNAATRRDTLRVLKNTLAMSGLGIITSWVPMVFAIFLSEIKSNKFRKVVQTLTTIPNFISWVLVYAIALAIFSSDGFINTFLSSITGSAHETNFLMSSSGMWIKMLLWGLWKTLGWSAIIYIASISGIDQQLYEAARVDGADRFQRMWHITVPGLLPTYFVILLMSIANVLSNGMEQYLVFSNPINSSSVEVLDLYTYNLGIGNGAIPLSTAIGMMKSIVSVVLLFVANSASKLSRGESII